MTFLGRPLTDELVIWDGSKFVSHPTVDRRSAEGRLTLVSADPVPVTDQTAKSIVYYTTYLGNDISLYDGAAWILFTFSELSITLASLTSGANYDVFAFSNSGTPKLELSAAWSTDVARADALVRQDGIWVKSSDHTRRYLGTIRTTATTTTEDSKTKRFVWNFDNRVSRLLQVTEGADSWNQTVANTWRSTQGSNSNRVEMVRGMDEDPVSLKVLGLGTNNINGVVDNVTGVGLDATTTNSAALRGSQAFKVTDATITHAHAAPSFYVEMPGLGYHFLQQLELTGSTSVVWFGDGGGTVVQTGTVGECMA